MIENEIISEIIDDLDTSKKKIRSFTPLSKEEKREQTRKILSGELKEKYCVGCGNILPLTEFYKYSARADGYQIYCKDCLTKRRGGEEELVCIDHNIATKINRPLMKKAKEIALQEYARQNNINAEESGITKLTADNVDMDELEEKIAEEYATLIQNPNKFELQKEEKEKSLMEKISNKIIAQYDTDVQKADEIMQLFYERIANKEDLSVGAKEALTKALELRISSNQSMVKLMDLAIKTIDKTNKINEKGNGIDIENLKKNFLK